MLVLPSFIMVNIMGDVWIRTTSLTPGLFSWYYTYSLMMLATLFGCPSSLMAFTRLSMPVDGGMVWVVVVDANDAISGPL